MENNYNSPEPMYPAITLGDWMLTILLLALPIVNIIMLFIWAFGGGTNPTKVNFAKAVLIWMLISAILSLFFMSSIMALFGSCF